LFRIGPYRIACSKSKFGLPSSKFGRASDNFRGIALGSIFNKLFDNIVLFRYGSNLMSSELQFGFKAKSSTSLCSMVLKETMSYYINDQSPVFCMCLDASKAFHRVEYCKLFRLLIL